MDAYLAYEKEKIEQNPYLLVRAEYLKIKIKEPGIGETEFIKSFKLKQPQEKLVTLIESLREQGIPPRIWILKARQIGFSTLTEALIYSYTSQRKGRNACIIADDLKGTNYLFDMFKTYHEFFSKDFPHLAPETKKSNEKALIFKDMYSGIYPDTADNLDAGQKYTFVDVHWSEVALYRDAETLFDGFMQSMPDHADTLFIGESTANGYGGFFYEQVMAAHEGSSDWILFFVPWFDEPGYRKLVDFEQIAFMEKTITKEEEALLKIHKCDWEQLWWRRWAIINKIAGGKNSENVPKGYYQPDERLQKPLETFHEKYPATVEEAFIATGDCRFEKIILQEWQAKAPMIAGVNKHLIPTVNYIEGYFFLDNSGYLEFVQLSNGPWKIFYYPEDGVDYCFGADVAEGIEILEGSKRYDYSTIVILRRDTLEQVAQYRAHIEPDLFALECFYGLMFYNTPTAGIEANKDGQTTLKFLRNSYHYENIYVRIVIREERGYKRRTKELGWLTTEPSRHIMINDLAKFIRDEEGIFYSKTLISECLTFIKNPKGKFEHKEGCHDDLVIAAAIALQMHLVTPHTEAWRRRAHMTR